MEVLFFLGAALVFLTAKGIYDNIKHKKKVYSAIKGTFGKLNDDENIDERAAEDGRFYFAKESERSKDFVIDDITAGDLALDYFFLKTDVTRSAAGSACYYNLLRTPVFDEKELEHRENLIKTMSADEEKRVKLQAALSRMPHSHGFHVHACIDEFKKGEVGSVFTRYMSSVLLIGSIIFAVIVNNSASVLFPVVVIIYNIATYYIQKSNTDGFIYQIKTIIAMYNAASEVVKLDNEELAEENRLLKTDLEKLKKLKKASWAIRTNFSEDLMAILMDYVNMLLHLDLISLNKAIICAAKEEKSILSLNRTMGYIDALTSISSLRACGKEWCVPELKKDGKPYLNFTKATHFLLSDPVPADLETDRHMLITGSNASGKSTFLKTVALNALFAQTIHTCFAESYSGSFFKVITGMSLSDNIISGESYYITEIKALKRIMDDNDETPVLCFSDEILRGTNTVERIAASTSSLRFLAKQNKLVFAATHDIELTTLLKDEYRNFHFSETLDEDGNIGFDYMLKEGPSETRNAILMLKAYGYDGQIIEDSSAMAEQFAESGVWKNPRRQ